MNILLHWQAEIKKKDVEIESHKKTIASHHSALRAAETTVTKMERERIQQEAHQVGCKLIEAEWCIYVSVI